MFYQCPICERFSLVWEWVQGDACYTVVCAAKNCDYANIYFRDDL